MKFTAIIQARMGSSRLPEKIFLPLAGKPILWHVVERVSRSKGIDEVVVATSKLPADDRVETWSREKGVPCFRGSEQDVLSRYYEAAAHLKAENIVRITADDPFKDPEVIDRVIELYQRGEYDFAYNTKPTTFPEGLDVEIFTVDSLAIAFHEAIDPFDREHVTPYLYRHPDRFFQANLSHDEDLSFLRWTIDTCVDYQMAENIYNNLYGAGGLFLMKDILAYLNKNPKVMEINRDVERSAMYSV
jgi:spore coat polysaccharide biosynthesis protein SpsF